MRGHNVLTSRTAAAACIVAGLMLQPHAASEWIEPDWAGEEPSHEAGSLEWRTGAYPETPIVYRTVLEAEAPELDRAVLDAVSPDYLYVFLNGEKIAGGAQADSVQAEFSHKVRPGPNVLAISAPPEGFSLSGLMENEEGRTQRFATGVEEWRVQKFPPLTLLETQPFMEAGFDDSGWFHVQSTGREPLERSEAELRQLADDLANERLARWDEVAEWRLHMLASEGFSVVDWEAHGFGGAGRLPVWLREQAEAWRNEEPAVPGERHRWAEALSLYVLLRDEALNLHGQARGLASLEAEDGRVDRIREAATERAGSPSPVCRETPSR